MKFRFRKKFPEFFRTGLHGLIFLLLLFSSVLVDAEAQVRFGVILSAEQSEQINPHELDRLQRMGVSVVAPQAHFSEETFGALSGSGMEVWPVLPLRYVLRGTELADPEVYLRFLRRFERLTTFNGVIVGWHADLGSAQVSAQLQALSEVLRNQLPAQKLFLITNGAAVPSEMLRPIADAKLGIGPASFAQAPLLLPPAPSVNQKIAFAAQVREGIAQGYGIFLTDYNNLQAYIDDDESTFAEIMSGFTAHSNPAIPLPEAEEVMPAINYSVLLVVLLWLSFAVHLRYNPNYNRTVGRYFLSHTFLIDDILRRHILLSGSIFIVFVQLSVMWGVFSLSFTTAYLGASGMQVLTYYFPLFSSEVILFGAGAFFGALFNGILWVWLILSCFRNDVVSMSGTLLFWPMHAGLLLLLLLLTFQGAGAGSLAMLIVALLFLGVQLAAFIVASLAFSRQPSLKPGPHILATLLPYIVLMSILILFFIRESTLFGIFRLAFWLNN
ncbi:hypothetical protein CYPRO_2357 [Cyclonatronum proteinivorum]|uniref:Uncharacterized protein n=1 Tax=Cyclonatronum proteinivorum TaxID=1457365 RepID=A0A345UM97_9BACT|nr:hypothetical protein [Cyclonatronum proteinivorum]AXJ01599.1 hypothetical protein CYPRO_2357 [Cyclonatronum proteinivorum]